MGDDDILFLQIKTLTGRDLARDCPRIENMAEAAPVIALNTGLPGQGRQFIN